MNMEYYKKYEPFFGSWHITKMLGEGSFGKVFEIERQDFGETYKAALKIITVPQSESEVRSIMYDGMDERSTKEYFESIVKEIISEYVLMSKLKGNSHIVSYEDHQVIPHEGKLGWDIIIRMELLTSLMDYAQTKVLKCNDVMRLGIDICQALELCQKHNIIHRDIKPENIFVSGNGNFKLGDFGIARTIEKTSSGLSKKGTYTYMAPEIYKGEEYGSSVDIYSLGIVMYRLMNNNRTPFLPPYPEKITHSNRDNSLIKRISGETLPAPSEAEGRLVEIILKACAYSPKERYSSPMQMRSELEAILYETGESKIIYPKGDKVVVNTNDYVKTDDEVVTNKTSSDEGTVSIYGSVLTETDERQEDLLKKPSQKREPQIVSEQNEKSFVEQSTPVYEYKEKTFLIVAGILLGFVLMVVLWVWIMSRQLTIDTGDYLAEQLPETIIEEVIDKDEEYVEQEVLEELESAYEKEPVIPDYITIGERQYCKSLTELELSLFSLTNEDIKPLRYMVHLERLSIFAGPIDDLTPLSSLSNLIELNLSGDYISDLSPLSNLTNLEILVLGGRGDQIMALNPLSNLTNLRSLRLWGGGKINDFSFLTSVTSLTEFGLQTMELTNDNIIQLGYLVHLEGLSIGVSGLYDVSPLSNLINLEWLSLYKNQINDVSFLSSLPNLESLNLSYNQISDISVLSNLPNLESLSLFHNLISDVSVLSNLPNLEELWLGYNPISDISVLSNLPNLKWLDLTHNQISDVSALSNLSNLEWLNLWNSQINDVSALSGLTNLEWLNLRGNQISDISALSNLLNLKELDLMDNQISDISALSNLLNLERLCLAFNQISDISALSNLPNLVSLDLRENQINDWSPVSHIENVLGRP